MSDVAPAHPTVEVPARRLRLLANLWLPAAVLLGLGTISAAGVTVQSVVVLVGLIGRAGTPHGPVIIPLFALLVGGLAVVVLGRITWRLAVEVPRTVRDWERALDERRRAVAG